MSTPQPSSSPILCPPPPKVVNCKDAIAQAYLLDCVIHVFPDDFHWATLEAFLRTCTQLKEKVRAWKRKIPERVVKIRERVVMPQRISFFPISSFLFAHLSCSRIDLASV